VDYLLLGKLLHFLVPEYLLPGKVLHFLLDDRGCGREDLEVSWSISYLERGSTFLVMQLIVEENLHFLVDGKGFGEEDLN